MRNVETAAAAWKRICEAATLDTHPAMMVCHDNIRIVAYQPHDESRLTLQLGSPFAISEVSDMWVIRDRPNLLLMTHCQIEGGGIHTTDWELAYSVGDHGEISFGIAEKTWETRIRGAIKVLTEHRLKHEDPYPVPLETSVHAAVAWGLRDAAS